MNQLATANTNNAVAVASDKSAFEQYSDAVNQNRIVGDIIKFNKGEYFAGQNEDEVALGTRLIANMDEAMVGWLRWGNKKVIDMQMGRIAEGYRPAKRSELGDMNEADWELDDEGRPQDPWSLTNYLIFKAIDSKQLYTFSTSSKGGIGAVGRLCGDYGKMMRQKPDEFPIISLDTDSYKHPVYKKVYTPSFKIVGWTKKADMVAALAGEAERASQDDADSDAGASEEDSPPAGRKPGRPKAAATTQF